MVAADSARLGPPKRVSARKRVYDVEGTKLEIVLADDYPFFLEVARLSQGEPEVDVPLVGRCVAASLETLFVLKSTFVAYPVHFYKTLADYHTLKGLIGRLPPSHLALAKLGFTEARRRFEATWSDVERRPETCAFGHHEARADWTLHVALHERLRKGASLVEPGWARHPPDTHVLGEQRSQWVARIAEEAMVVALEQRGDPAAFRFALRLLITRLLPLSWRYFVADAWPELTIAANALATSWASAPV